MIENPLEFVRRFFDFDYEDQPNNLEDYDVMIDYMWSKAKAAHREKEIGDSIKALLVSQEDASEKMGFVFLPGKHEVEDILKLALERMPSKESKI